MSSIWVDPSRSVYKKQFIEVPRRNKPKARNSLNRDVSSLLESVLLALVEQVRLGTAKVDDLWTAIAVLLSDGALLAVVRVTDPRAPADDAPPLVRPVVALVTDAHECAGAHVRVTYDTFSVTFFT